MRNLLRRNYSHTIRIIGEKEIVFKSFCPVAEKEWVPGWEYQMIYSDSGIAEKNCIFTTKNNQMPDSVWICSKYEPGYEIEYIKVVPNFFVTTINILVEQVGSNTDCSVKYTHTSLSKFGEQYITAHFSQEQLTEQINEWESKIPIYLDKHK